MKTYVIEDKVISLKSGKTCVCFIGKDEYVRSFPENCNGYKLKSVALQNTIKKCFSGYDYKQLDDTHVIESENWLHIFRVVEIEER